MTEDILLARKLRKANISKNRYETENKTLEKLGYSEYQRERIILRLFSGNSVTRLIMLHKKLLEHFNHQQLTRLVARDGGSNNLEAVSESFKALKTLGFTAEHIVKIAGNIGGSKNIAAVSESFKALKTLGFTVEHIVKIAGHNGGSKNIEAVSESFKDLKALGFTAEHIVKIAGHKGGSKNIALIRENYAKLIAAPVNWSELANLFNKPGSAARRLFLEKMDSLSISAAKEQQTASCAELMMLSHLSKKRRRDKDRASSEQSNLSKRNPESSYSLVSNSLFATSKRRKISVSELLNPENTMNTPPLQNN